MPKLIGAKGYVERVVQQSSVHMEGLSCVVRSSIFIVGDHYARTHPWAQF